MKKMTLKALTDERGITIKELSCRSGISHKACYDVFKDEHKVRFFTVAVLAETLGMTVDDFVEVIGKR